jgi:hypothetical protein
VSYACPACPVKREACLTGVKYIEDVERSEFNRGAVNCEPLLFEKNLEFYPDAPIANPDNFSGCHNGFAGSGEYECHCYLLPGDQGPAGPDKSPAGTYVLNKSFKVGIHRPANGNNRLDFVEPFPGILPCFKAR